MADLFSGFSGWGGAAAVGKGLLWLIIILICGAILFGIIIFLLVQLKKTRIIEIDMDLKRLKQTTGRTRKSKKGTRQFWVGGFIQKFLPLISGENLLMQGKRNVAILLKDKNGFHHTARVPTYEELRAWYNNVYGLDLDDPVDREKIMSGEKITDVFLLPNPHEDLEWAAAQALESEKTFSANHWWESPVAAYVGVGFVCLLMIIFTLILGRKMI